jgi:hypothetical protein
MLLCEIQYSILEEHMLISTYSNYYYIVLQYYIIQKTWVLNFKPPSAGRPAALASKLQYRTFGLQGGGPLTSWPIDQLAGWPVGRFVGWPVGQSAGTGSRLELLQYYSTTVYSYRLIPQHSTIVLSYYCTTILAQWAGGPMGWWTAGPFEITL